jgi:hypothetical protein
LIFQLSYNNFEEKLVFPVSPGSFKVYGGGTDFNDFMVVKSGEATVIGDLKMREISFSSFFPRHYDPVTCGYYDIPHPYTALNLIQKWRRSKRPVRLIITGLGANMPVTIRSFEYEERGGQPEDVYFSIAFKEYRFITIRQIEQEVNAEESTIVETEPASARPDLSVTPTTHTVQAGDSLWTISKRYLGNSDRWMEIYQANRDTIDFGNAGQRATLETIHPGQRLVIP